MCPTAERGQAQRALLTLRVSAGHGLGFDVRFLVRRATVIPPLLVDLSPLDFPITSLLRKRPCSSEYAANCKAGFRRLTFVGRLRVRVVSLHAQAIHTSHLQTENQQTTVHILYTHAHSRAHTLTHMRTHTQRQMQRERERDKRPGCKERG